MAKRLSLLLIALLVAGFTVAGCGDDDDKSSDDNANTAAQTETTGGSSDTDTTETESADTETTESGGGSGPDVSDNPQVKQAVAQCKQSVNSSPQLKADTKKKLADICDKAASGDQSGIKEASKEVCLAIIEDTGISGSAAETAKQQCETISK